MLLGAIGALAVAGIHVLITVGLVVHDVPRGEYERAFVVGFALLGTFPLCLAVAALLLLRRSCWVVLHEHGMVAAAALGAPLVLPWWDVLELLPPPADTKYPSFEVRTRADRRLVIPRLLRPPRLTVRGVPHASGRGARPRPLCALVPRSRADAAHRQQPAVVLTDDSRDSTTPPSAGAGRGRLER